MRPNFLPVTAALVAVVALSACGGDDESSSEDEARLDAAIEQEQREARQQQATKRRAERSRSPADRYRARANAFCRDSLAKAEALTLNQPDSFAELRRLFDRFVALSRERQQGFEAIPAPAAVRAAHERYLELSNQTLDLLDFLNRSIQSEEVPPPDTVGELRGAVRRSDAQAERMRLDDCVSGPPPSLGLGP